MIGRTLTVWRLSDGRPGHDSQSRGLVEALARRVPLRCADVPVPGLWRTLLGRLPWPEASPPPDLLVAAGHATHLPLLVTCRRHGGRSVVLMRPSLPTSWFDLCLVPEHDGIAESAHVLLTRGSVNSVCVSDGPRDGNGLLLIGGPSRHHEWDGADLLEQVAAVVAAEPSRSWTLTTSRRTPAGFVYAVRGLQRDNLTVTPAEATGPDWLAGRLATAEVAWVGEDSVSMVYEALTGGCRVGLLGMPPRGGTGRVLRGLDRLVEEDWVVDFPSWRAGSPLPATRGVFNEAVRCADAILERWWPGS